jgi:hypothetical protein
MKKINFIYVSYCLIFLSFAVSIFIHFNFRGLDLTPFSWDQMTHLVFTLEYSRYLKAADFHNFLYYFNEWYTPLVYWIASPFVDIVNHKFLPLMINVLFTIFVVSLIFLYSRHGETEKKKPILVSLYILGFLYLVIPDPTSATWNYINIREYWLDYPLAAMEIGLFESLIYYWGKKKLMLKDIFIFTFLIFAIIYTKNVGFIFVFPFVFLFIIKILKQDNRFTVKTIQTLLLTEIFLLLSRWFWVNRLKFLENIQYQNLMGHLEQDPQGLRGLLAILHWTLLFQPLLIAILGIFIFVNIFYYKAYAKLKHSTSVFKIFIFVSMVLLIFLTLISNKEPRYILPFVWLFYYFIIRVSINFISSKFYKFILLTSVILLPIRTLENLPIPMLQTSAYHYIDNFLKVNKPGRVGFYYETDSPFFNSTSARYLLEINGVAGHYDMNDAFGFAGTDLNNRCYSINNSFVIVYSESSTNSKSKQTGIDFDKNCNELIKNCKSLDEQIFNITNESLKVYYCKW